MSRSGSGAIRGQVGDLKTLEEKINRRVAQSIEDLGELMKDQAKKFRKYNDRLGDLESKVFGRVKTTQAKPSKAQ